MLSNPAEMYNYLLNKEIGTEHAVLYKAHALILETMGRYKEAEDAFKLGIARNVSSMESLRSCHALFTERMVERVRILQQKRQERAEEGTSNTTASRSSTRAPSRSSRSGLSHAGPSKTLSYSTMPNVPLKNGTVLSVLRDDDVTVPNAPKDEIKVRWDEFATEADAGKENVRTATAWLGKTLPQRSTTRPTSTTGFSIYIDPECQEESTPNDNANDSPPPSDMEDADYLQMIQAIKNRVARPLNPKP